MKIPSNEKSMVSYVFEGVRCYVITHSTLKGKFTLYKQIGEDYQKLKTADSPLEFDEIVEKDRGK